MGPRVTILVKEARLGWKQGKPQLSNQNVRSRKTNPGGTLPSEQHWWERLPPLRSRALGFLSATKTPVQRTRSGCDKAQSIFFEPTNLKEVVSWEEA